MFTEPAWLAEDLLRTIKMVTLGSHADGKDIVCERSDRESGSRPVARTKNWRQDALVQAGDLNK